MNEIISILVVDDNALLRIGLAEAISREADMELAGEAANGKEALIKYRELKPDVVVMDYRMPVEDGVEGTRNIVEEFPDAKIVLLSVYEGEEDIWNAWNAGVRGYLSKSDAAENFMEAVRAVAKGDTCFPEGIAQKLEARQGRNSLTRREMQVLQCIVDGHTNKEIEGKLDISEGTVKLHVRNMLEKLEVSDRTQAAVKAMKNGIIHVE